MADTTVVRKPGEGDAYWLLGGLYEQKAGADETGGAMTIFEITLPAGAGPPSHTHAAGEAVYVLEGNILYHIDGEVHEGGAGSFFYIPEGTWENFEPLTHTRLLVMYLPGGAERFFAEVAEPAQARKLPPPPTEPPDIKQLIATAEKHGMKMKPPEGATA